MCTVSLVPAGDGVRIVCNRDERRDRPPALGPAMRTAGDYRAWYPLDAAGGGTWIGVNETGLSLVLLNQYPGGTPATATLESRGTIIPRLLAEGAIRHVMDAALALVPSRYEPFRLLVVRGATLGVVESNGSRVTGTVQRLVHPVCFSSSSVGGRRVEALRQALFARTVLRESRGWLRGQYLFHRHQWRRRPHLSVLMRRDDACTVSRTVIDARPGGSVLRYEALDPPARPVPLVALSGAA